MSLATGRPVFRPQETGEQSESRTVLTLVKWNMETADPDGPVIEMTWLTFILTSTQLKNILIRMCTKRVT